MADKDRKWSENVPGRFYVDQTCAFCSTCFELAPTHFRPSTGEDHHYVARQPATPDEVSLLLEVVKQCPMGAVGDDG